MVVLEAVNGTAGDRMRTTVPVRRTSASPAQNGGVQEPLPSFPSSVSSSARVSSSMRLAI